MSNSRRSGILAGLLVGLMVATAMPGFFAASPVASVPVRAGTSGVTAASIAYQFNDFFNVPYAEFWDLRLALYGDLPINAECFSAEGIAEGLCVPSQADVADISSYPYTNWYPGVGNPQPGNPNSDIFVNAPYRMQATGSAVQGYTLAEPVYFPVLKPAEGAGTQLDFNWYMQYLTLAQATELEAQGCPSLGLDGYHIRSQIDLTMDLQESKRLFGVTATDAVSAQSWWDSNTNPACAGSGPVESAVNTWFVQMGGSQFALGKYDIYNSYEWYYQPFFTQISATVDPDGTTHVMIDHVAWGTEVLLARFFYWGAASYVDNYLDSTKALGWWGMEMAWFEDLSFAGSFTSTDHSFSLGTAIQYHFQQLNTPGANGLYDRVDDVPFWQWAPWLNDYVNDFSPRHLLSELDRIPGATLVQTAPGHPKYGQQGVYDFTPITWDFKSFETAVFQFPAGNVVFYDPYLTPLGANPITQYVPIYAPLTLLSTVPDAMGIWDETTNTWTITGPLTTGCPVGSPGPDGVPGTADDEYPLEGCPAINLGVEQIVQKIAKADLVKRSAWPERHHWVQSKDVDGMQTLYGLVGNLGNVDVNATVVFKIYDSTGALVATVETAVASIPIGSSATVSADWMPSGMGRFSVIAQAMYDADLNGSVESGGAKLKSFSFAVVP